MINLDFDDIPTTSTDYCVNATENDVLRGSILHNAPYQFTRYYSKLFKGIEIEHVINIGNVNKYVKNKKIEYDNINQLSNEERFWKDCFGNKVKQTSYYNDIESDLSGIAISEEYRKFDVSSIDISYTNCLTVDTCIQKSTLHRLLVSKNIIPMLQNGSFYIIENIDTKESEHIEDYIKDVRREMDNIEIRYFQFAPKPDNNAIIIIYKHDDLKLRKNIGIVTYKKKTLKAENRMFTNGLYQNVMTLYRLLNKRIDYNVFFLHDTDDDEYTYLNYSYVQKASTTLIKEPIKLHYLLEAGGILNDTIKVMFKKHYSDMISIGIVYGHMYYSTMKHMLGKKTDPNIVSLGNHYDCKLISPHFEWTKDMYQALYKCPVYTAPYIWSSRYIDMKPFTETNIKNVITPNIIVMEPNLDEIKNSVAPMMIMNEFWKKYPDYFNQFAVVTNHPFREIPYYKTHFLKKFDILHPKNKKTVFLPRQRFSSLFKYPAIILSYQRDCELNYVYMEAFYCNIPLVHNSDMCKESKYYYKKLDIPMAVDSLKRACEDFNNNILDTSGHKYVEKYSDMNEDNIREYYRLIDTSKRIDTLSRSDT